MREEVKHAEEEVKHTQDEVEIENFNADLSSIISAQPIVHLENELIDKVEQAIMKREIYSNKYADIFYQKLLCWPCKKLKTKGILLQNGQEQMFNKGFDKYKYELDGVEIIQSMRQLKTLVNLVMTEQQQTIQKFVKDGLISN